MWLNDSIDPLVPALQSNWLTYHVITCFLGYAAFALACGVSIMYLIKVGKEEKAAEESPIGGILGMYLTIGPDAAWAQRITVDLDGTWEIADSVEAEAMPFLRRYSTAFSLSPACSQ